MALATALSIVSVVLIRDGITKIRILFSQVEPFVADRTTDLVGPVHYEAVAPDNGRVAPIYFDQPEILCIAHTPSVPRGDLWIISGRLQDVLLAGRFAMVKTAQGF